MNIYTYQAQFEELMCAVDSPPSIEQAWAYFKDSIRQGLEENYIDQIGFSAGYAGDFDSKKLAVNYDKDIFRVWFGRVIDAEKPAKWRFAEIDFYFHYQINDELSRIATMTPPIAIEDFYRKSDGERVIQPKMEAVFAFADEKPFIWDAIRDVKLINSEIHFWLH